MSHNLSALFCFNEFIELSTCFEVFVFHNVLSSVFQYSHPSVWSLLDGLERDLACHNTLLKKQRTARGKEEEI